MRGVVGVVVGFTLGLMSESQQALLAHILASMQATADGAPLPANGIETVCQYCEVRGLCRKGAW